MEAKKKIAFPRYAEYGCCFKYVIEQGADAIFIEPPEITKKTLELGSKHSPDFVCTPFKTTLGSMIEALEAGADTLLMTNGICKLGYYGELQEVILRDLGYEFDFINISEYVTNNKLDYLKPIKRMNPKAKKTKMILAIIDAAKMLEYIDEITGIYYQNCGFELVKGSYKKAYQNFINDMKSATNKRDIENGYKKVKEAFANIAVDKGDTPLKVAILGEIYTAVDAASNLEVEQKLADMHVEVHRHMTMTNRLFKYSGEKNLNVKIHDLCEYEMGPTSTMNIFDARRFAQAGFDGLIHIKSANCTAEIDVMPVLQRISDEEKIPVLYLTFDSQTSDVGLMTRLEAFYDMIKMRKKVI